MRQPPSGAAERAGRCSTRIADTKNDGTLRADYRPNICGGTETRAGLHRTWRYGRTCTPAEPHSARSLPRRCGSRAAHPLLYGARHSANTSWSGSSAGGSVPRHRAIVSASSWAAASRMVSVGAVIPTRAQPGAASKAVATRDASMIIANENIYGTLTQGRGNEGRNLNPLGKPRRLTRNTTAQHAQRALHA